MQIWPAIDLRGGKCVRLRQGDYQQETVFAQEPADVARQFADQGAQHLHIVDLEGAREGLPVNLPSVQAILAAVDIECELGGGIRDEQTVREILDFGLSRLVVGTSALTDPEWFRDICRFAKAIIVELTCEFRFFEIKFGGVNHGLNPYGDMAVI